MMKLGAAISGGSTKIDYMNGVFCALKDRGIFDKIDLFAGTSSGAILSAVYGTLDPHEVRSVLGEFKKRSDFFQFYPWSLKGIYSLKPVRKILDKILKPSHPRDVNSVAVWVDYDYQDYPIVYSDRHEVGFDKFIDAVMYSATVPVLMHYKKNKYDGGVREYMPMEYAKSRCQYVIAVASSPEKNPHVKAEKKPWWLPRIFWTLWVTVDEAMQQELKKCDFESEDENVVVIRPSEDLGLGTFDVDPVKRKRIAEIGYNDGMKAEIPKGWFR